MSYDFLEFPGPNTVNMSTTTSAQAYRPHDEDTTPKKSPAMSTPSLARVHTVNPTSSLMHQSQSPHTRNTRATSLTARVSHWLSAPKQTRPVRSKSSSVIDTAFVDGFVHARLCGQCFSEVQRYGWRCEPDSVALLTAKLSHWADRMVSAQDSDNETRRLERNGTNLENTITPCIFDGLQIYLLLQITRMPRDVQTMLRVSLMLMSGLGKCVLPCQTSASQCPAFIVLLLMLFKKTQYWLISPLRCTFG